MIFKHLTFIRIKALVTVSIMLSGALWAQSTRPSPSLKIGSVDLSLGMSQKEITAQITQAGYKMLELPAENGYARVAVTDRDLTDKVQSALAAVDNDGVLYFKNGALARMSKQVTDDTAKGRDLAFALYAVVQDLQKTGDTQCSVNTTYETYSDVPGMDAKTILLTCHIGGYYKTIHIRWVTNEKLQEQLPVGVFQELWR